MKHNHPTEFPLFPVPERYRGLPSRRQEPFYRLSEFIDSRSDLRELVRAAALDWSLGTRDHTVPLSKLVGALLESFRATGARLPPSLGPALAGAIRRMVDRQRPSA